MHVVQEGEGRVRIEREGRHRKGRGEGGEAQEGLFIACIDVSSEMLLYAQDSAL